MELPVRTAPFLYLFKFRKVVQVRAESYCPLQERVSQKSFNIIIVLSLFMLSLVKS